MQHFKNINTIKYFKFVGNETLVYDCQASKNVIQMYCSVNSTQWSLNSCLADVFSVESITKFVENLLTLTHPADVFFDRIE